MKYVCMRRKHCEKSQGRKGGSVVFARAPERRKRAIYINHSGGRKRQKSGGEKGGKTST